VTLGLFCYVYNGAPYASFAILTLGTLLACLIICLHTGGYGKSTAPFLSCLAKKLVDISGDPKEVQWLHQRLSLAVVRGNTASLLACVQV